MTGSLISWLLLFLRVLLFGRSSAAAWSRGARGKAAGRSSGPRGNLAAATWFSGGRGTRLRLHGPAERLRLQQCWWKWPGLAKRGGGQLSRLVLGSWGSGCEKMRRLGEAMQAAAAAVAPGHVSWRPHLQGSRAICCVPHWPGLGAGELRRGRPDGQRRKKQSKAAPWYYAVIWDLVGGQKRPTKKSDDGNLFALLLGRYYVGPRNNTFFWPVCDTRRSPIAI
jgi:hypothetical protein